MRPGATQLTVIPFGPSSLASVFAQPVTPGRTMFERARCDVGSRTATEVIAITRPASLRSRCGRQRPTRRTAGSSSRSTACCTASAVKSTALPAGGPPEFQTTMSTPPNVSSVVWTIRSRSSGLVTSPGTARAPICSASRSSSSRRRPRIATSAPSATSAWADARPSPEEAPQTIAVRPASPRSIDGAPQEAAAVEKTSQFRLRHQSDGCVHMHQWLNTHLSNESKDADNPHRSTVRVPPHGSRAERALARRAHSPSCRRMVSPVHASQGQGLRGHARRLEATGRSRRRPAAAALANAGRALGRQDADDFAHRLGRGAKRALLLVREVELDDLLHAAGAELHRYTHVEPVDAVFALEVRGAREDALLVEHDRVDHLRRGRARRIPRRRAEQVHDLAPALRGPLDHRLDLLVGDELAQWNPAHRRGRHD